MARAETETTQNRAVPCWGEVVVVLVGERQHPDPYLAGIFPGGLVGHPPIFAALWVYLLYLYKDVKSKMANNLLHC